MRILRKLLTISVFCAFGLPLAAQSTYILTVSPSNVQTVLSSHNLTVVKELYDGANCVYLVSSPSTDTSSVEVEVEKDLLVIGFEPDQQAALPELSGSTQALLTQSVSPIVDTLPGRTAVLYFGSSVPSNYVSQAATSIIRLNDARTATNLTGSGVVAIIDTGADPGHPALTGVLVPGFDFTRNIAGSSELADLNPTLASLLSTPADFLSAQNVFVLNASTGAILDQSVSPLLDQSVSPIVDGTLPDFGHGTMVAGVVHLIAPTAIIMPLKAFRADGTGNLSDIVNAIYYAANQGANIISMSFSMSQSSLSLQTAIQYALNKNVTLVASAGNDGLKTLVYPASYGGVEGVGSTSNTDVRSSFSNYGSGVTLFAAPGEGVITTYPGGNYAAAWGTSFSAPMVAGAAALVLQARPASKPGDITNALSKAKQISDMGGYGRIDLYQALTNLVSSSTSGGGTSGGK